MESRLLKYKKKKRKNKFKLFCVLSSLTILLCSTLLLEMLPGTHAWFITKSTAVGTIQNAKSSDLVNIKVGNTKYLNQCKIKSTLTVKNISSTDIPIKIKLIKPNNNESLMADITLQGNSMYTTDPTVINLQEDQCSKKNIEYQVIGFNGYINEYIPIPVDEQKLQATSGSPVINQANANNNPLAPVQGSEQNINTPSSVNSSQGSGPVNNTSAVGIDGTANSQSSIGASTNGIEQAPQGSGPTGNSSASTPVDSSGNISQTQGTESAPIQP